VKGNFRPLHLIHLFWSGFWCEIEAISSQSDVAQVNKLSSWNRMLSKDADELAEVIESENS
jgi:hypothetical protein